jgi:hypothetical protein
MVVKAGVGYDKNTRDLIWIGDAPNLGAKLSDDADSPFSIYVCEETFGRIIETNRYTNNNGTKTDMWARANFTFKKSTINIYKTGYYRQL